MRTFWIFAFMLVFAGVATPANAARKNQTEALYAKLDTAWRSGKDVAVRNLINGGEVHNFERRQVLANWAEKNYTFSVSRNPRMGLIYAETLALMGDEYARTRKDVDYYKTMINGLGVFLSSQLIAFENVARCADKSVGSSYISNWTQGAAYQTYKQFLERQSDADRNGVWARAKNLSDTRNLERKDRELCATGADAIARAQVADDCQNVKGGGETCHAVNHVEFVSDEAWNASRQKVQEAVKRRVLEGKI